MLKLAGFNVGIKIKPNKLVNEEQVTDTAPQTNIESL